MIRLTISGSGPGFDSLFVQNRWFKPTIIRFFFLDSSFLPFILTINAMIRSWISTIQLILLPGYCMWVLAQIGYLVIESHVFNSWCSYTNCWQSVRTPRNNPWFLVSCLTRLQVINSKSNKNKNKNKADPWSQSRFFAKTLSKTFKRLAAATG